MLSAFDNQVQKCLQLYQSFLTSPAGTIGRAVRGEREAALLTGLFALFAGLFATVLYITLVLPS